MTELPARAAAGPRGAARRGAAALAAALRARAAFGLANALDHVRALAARDEVHLEHVERGEEQLRAREARRLARGEAREHRHDATYAVRDPPRDGDALDHRIEELARRANLVALARARFVERLLQERGPEHGVVERPPALLRQPIDRVELAPEALAPAGGRLVVVDERRELREHDRHRARLPEIGRAH